FWVDLTRSTLYILLPLSIVLAVFLVQQGVPQTTDGKETAALLDAQPGTPPADARPGTIVSPVDDQPRDATRGGVNGPASPDQGGRESPPVINQPIAVGPVASQVAIKQLGTNGGGYYNVNSAHPLENPTPLANFLELLAILLISTALCVTFGRMVGDTRQGWALLAAMFVIFVPLTLACYAFEQAGNS